ncbi:MAG: putative bifunctional diguanylate cyclase/phosphodiesterase [Erythrobacter sp.]
MTKRQLPLLAVPLLPLALLMGVLALATGPGGEELSGTTSAVLVAAAAILYGLSIFYLGKIVRAPISDDSGEGITDSLSLLPNRRALHADIDNNHIAGQEIALALIDLDSFKQVNDHYGHVIGDQLIRQCAGIMREICGEEARCYRLGGDEFAITMMGPVAGNILEGMCRKVIERLGKPLQLGKREVVVGASIGLSRSNGNDGLGSSELLRRSDVAMYASKRAGKMRCTWFSEDLDRNREAQREMDTELRRALANDEFQLHYQPLVDAESRAIVAVEALIRWNRPDGKQVGPHIFIPVAEESGFINAIGVWALRRACTDALAWDGIMLSVNISAAQLRNPEFPVQLGHILEETGFPAEQLELEITETCLVLDPVVAERNLAVIRGFGVNISLDDFGTGYASIGFLRQFRFEKLKLDRSLVVDAGTDEGSRAMMLSSITVARALKMGVTAEGVETEEQATMVRAAGCDQIQGWLFYKAMPADQIQQHLSRAAVASQGHGPAIYKGVA